MLKFYSLVCSVFRTQQHEHHCRRVGSGPVCHVTGWLVWYATWLGDWPSVPCDWVIGLVCHMSVWLVWYAMWLGDWSGMPHDWVIGPVCHVTGWLVRYAMWLGDWSSMPCDWVIGPIGNILSRVEKTTRMQEAVTILTGSSRPTVKLAGARRK